MLNEKPFGNRAIQIAEAILARDSSIENIWFVYTTLRGKGAVATYRIRLAELIASHEKTTRCQLVTIEDNEDLEENTRYIARRRIQEIRASPDYRVLQAILQSR